MTMREILKRGYQHGQQLLKIVRARPNNNHKISFTPCSPSSILARAYQHQPLQVWANNSVSFLNSAWKVCLQCCKKTWAAHLRRQASLNFMVREFNGRRSVSLLAFVGVGMVSISNSQDGLLTTHDEMKTICEQIRMKMSVLPTNEQTNEDEPSFNFGEKLERFEIGHVIAKGCNAVVYSAKISTKISDAEDLSQVSELSREKIDGNFSEYPLAIKMMFNYDAESYAPVILRAMYRETLPAKKIMLFNDPSSAWDSRRFKSCLTAHPNIVDMKYVFADQIPVLPEQLSLYPHALPSRLFPDGCGRNMTLFLVMRRYHKTLKEYLKSHHPPPNLSLIILSQILEGVHYLCQKNICHRDLKSDNILLNLSEGPTMPSVVITDFGCCTTRISIPFPDQELDQREGNVAMMAPEVSCACPGPFTYIDYRKADQWAVGVLAYEIYGMENPFYSSKIDGKKLDSLVYEEKDLPPLPGSVSNVVRSLIRNLLSRQPSKRMDASIAANVCFILLFAPKHWFLHSRDMPSDETITKWLVLKAASFASTSVHNYRLFNTMGIVFLKRVKLDEVIEAIRYIKSCS